MTKRVCAVVGVGPGNGAAFARRFSAEGYAVALLARGTALTGELVSTLPNARGYACDVSDGAAIAGAFESIRGDLGEVVPEVVGDPELLAQPQRHGHEVRT